MKNANNSEKEPVLNLLEWVVYGEIGTSSKTIWAAVIGATDEIGYKSNCFDVPYDAGDFRRCVLLIEQCGITFQQLQKVEKTFSWWKPFVDNWDNLVSLYQHYIKTGKYKQFEVLINQLVKESQAIRFPKSLNKQP